MLSRLVASFVPEHLALAGGLELRRAEILIKTAWFILLWSPPTLAFGYFVNGVDSIFLVTLACAVGFAAVPFILRSTGSLVAASNALIAALLVEMLWYGVTSSGIHAATMTAIIYAPLFGLVFQNRRAGLVWLMIALGVWTGLFVMGARGYPFPGDGFDEATRAGARLFELASASSVIFLLVSLKDGMQEFLVATLRAREAETAAVIATAPDGILVLTASGRVVSTNDAAGRIFGVDASSLLRQSIQALIPSLPTTALHATAAAVRGFGVTEEHEGKRGDTTFPVEVAFGHMENTDRAHFVLVIRDISDRKAAEDELIRARDEAQEASRAKSAFLANMSHELRTPLNAVIGYSEMIMEEIDSVREDGEEGAELVEQFVPDLARIRGAGKHLLSIINDILDLSKIEAGKMTIHVELFDSDELLRDIIGTIQPLADKNGNTIELIRADDAHRFLRTDTTKVRQILFNLLSNACKFTQDGVVRLHVGTDTTTGQAVFRVEDTGIGMTDEQMARIFDAFSQADSSTTREFGGTGLGLTITSHFSALLGGAIEVRSTPGEGTTFTVRIAADLDPGVEVDEPVATGANAPSAQRRMAAGHDTVLVVDDDPIMRDLLRRVLERGGFRVVCAASGSEGLLLAAELAPCAITLDVMMPGMDGWTMLARLKEDPTLAAIPVVMLTMVSESDRGFALGADHYLTKPLDRSALLRVLDTYRSEAPDSGAPVLLVEDDEPTRELIQRVLGQQGWPVVTAGNGVEALERLESTTPRLVLLDLMMPRMDGFEFLHRFRAHEPWRTIPVVVVTAKELTADDHDRLQAGANEVVPKGGLDRDRLVEQVRDLVQRYRTT